MKYTNSKSLIFEQGTQINITKDVNILFENVPNSLREFIDNNKKDSGNPKYLERLNGHIKEHPKVALLYKLLVSEYSRQEKYDLFAKHSIFYYKKFPNSFFAKLNMARVFMEQENHNGVASIYGKDISILYAFPDREQFHHIEIVDFLYFVIRYKLSLGEIEGAVKNEKKLIELEAEESMLEHVNEMIQYYKDELSKLNKITVSLTYNFNDVYTELGISPKEIDILDDFRNRLYDLKESSSNLVVELQILADKYPSNPYFKLFIADYYGMFKHRESFIESISVLLKEHPNFLMAKLEMAQLLLTAKAKDKSELDLVNDAVKLLDENLEFQYIKPYRKLYHIEEALMFYFVVLQIQLKYNKPTSAHNCLKIIKHIEGDSREYFFGKKLITDYSRGVAFNNYN